MPNSRIELSLMPLLVYSAGAHNGVGPRGVELVDEEDPGRTLATRFR